jgi:sigma-E factor negative regulatory protein RseC
METFACVAQKGTVKEVTDHRVTVSIHREEACGHCNASSMCNLANTEARIIEISDDGAGLRIGDHVEVSVSRSMGNRAVLLGYLLPFLVLISVLIFLNALGLQEWLSGLISLGMLVPYYFILYVFREKIKKKFTFTIRKTV